MQILLTLYERNSNSKKYYYIDFRRCEENDLIKRGINLDQDDLKSF